MSMLGRFWLCFIPLFVAVDVVGLLPLFIGLTEGIAPERVKRIILQSVLTAAVVALAFVFLGNELLRYLGITASDFMIAGGVLLFALSLSDLITMEKTRQQFDPESLGAVPLGVPLLVGPAVLTTSILLINEHGVVVTTSALILNILIAGLLFRLAPRIIRLLGKAGSKAVSKLASLLLAAIGVMMVRKGLLLLLGPLP
jgi:multiple antibiotic resistance protein